MVRKVRGDDKTSSFADEKFLVVALNLEKGKARVELRGTRVQGQGRGCLDRGASSVTWFMQE
jgi:hypothetical protein